METADDDDDDEEQKRRLTSCPTVQAGEKPRGGKQAKCCYVSFNWPNRYERHSKARKRVGGITREKEGTAEKQGASGETQSGHRESENTSLSAKILMMIYWSNRAGYA